MPLFDGSICCPERSGMATVRVGYPKFHRYGTRTFLAPHTSLPDGERWNKKVKNTLKFIETDKI